MEDRFTYSFTFGEVEGGVVASCSILNLCLICSYIFLLVQANVSEHLVETLDTMSDNMIVSNYIKKRDVACNVSAPIGMLSNSKRILQSS